MTDVLGTEDARSYLPALSRRERWTALAVAAVLGLGVVTAVRGVPAEPTLLVAADELLRVRTDGVREQLRLPVGQRPAKLLRLSGATVLLTRPPGRADGGSALLVRDDESSVETLGDADTVVPDSRGDRVWLVSGTAPRTLTAYDGRGRRLQERKAMVAADLLMVTPAGVLGDEVGRPGGSTPTLRRDDGSLLRALDGPVRVYDVAGPRMLVTAGNCLTGCTAQVWDVRDDSRRSAPLAAGLVVLDGALSTDGRSVALAARSTDAGNDLDGDNGQAVLLRGALDGAQPWQQTVTGGCTLLACRVTWSGDSVYASVDRARGAFVRWGPEGAPRRFALQVPGVVDLAGL